MLVPLVALAGLAVLALLPLPDERGVAVGAACVLILVVLRLAAMLRPSALRRRLSLGRGLHRRARIARKA